MKSCGRCGEENPDKARYCMTCATALSAEAPAPAEVRKTVSVVFCDVSGSTEIAQRLDPESLRRVMGRYFEEVRLVLERHGGTVEKFIGDAVMAVFGIPAVHEDDALRAVRAACEMREAVARLNDELQRDRGVSLAIRIGVNTGHVIAGEGSVGQDLVTGDAVNVAARLEQAAAPGEVLVGDATYRLVRHLVRAEPLGPVSVKGHQPVSAFRVFEVREIRAEALPTDRRMDSPLVGRASELEQLRDVLDRAVTQRVCALVSVVGSAGIGKSRLTAEFLATLGDGVRVLRGRCLPYGEGITFWPIAEIIREAAGISDASTAEAMSRIEALVAADPEGQLVAQRIAGIMGLASAGPAIQETYWAIRRLFETLARERPLVVVLDDIHWGQTAFLDLVEYLASSIADSRILLLSLARPDLLDARPEWSRGKPNSQAIHLTPLSEAESRALIRNLLGHAEVPEEVLVRITQAAEGNPLFVEEMLRMLVDEGLLRLDGTTWIAIGDLSRISIPPSIQAVLASRLDRLLAEERAVIQCASVVGKQFWWGAVADLAPELKDRMGTLLQSLVRKELIRPDPSDFAGEDGFRFGHILIRDAAYESIPKQTREELHERFARWLEHAAGNRVREFEEILAYHLENAHRYRVELGPEDPGARDLAARAARHLGATGLRAGQRGDLGAAVNLLGRAVSLLPVEDPLRLALVPELALVLIRLGEFRFARDQLESSITAARDSGNRGSEWWARVVLSFAQFSTHPGRWIRVAPQELGPAIEQLEASGLEHALALAWNLVAALHMQRGQAAEWARAAERAVDYARRADRPGDEAAYLGLLIGALVTGPTPVEEGLARCEELLATAEGNRVLEAQVLVRVGGLQSMRGDFQGGRDSIDRARAIFQDLGLVSDAARAAWNRAEVELLADDPVTAERYLRSACEVFEQRGEKDRLSGAALLLAETYFALGRFEESIAYMQFAERMGTLDDIDLHARGRALRAKMIARRGVFDQADSQCREAVAIAEGTDFLNLRGNILMDLADVLRVADRSAEAASAADRALICYEQKGNVAAAHHARALLDELALTG